MDLVCDLNRADRSHAKRGNGHDDQDTTWVTRRGQFAESLVDLLADWQLPRATGRVHASILLTKEPITLDELTNATGLSKGQVSTAVRELTSWGTRALDHGERQQAALNRGSVGP